MDLTFRGVIETGHENIGHNEIDETYDTCPQAEIRDLFEKRLVWISVDVFVHVTWIYITIITL